MESKASKNYELMKQYPFVSHILYLRMEPYDGNGGTKIDNLTIRVEKADSDLMFRRAENVGLDELSYIINLKNRKDQVGRLGEHLFAVDDNGMIVNRVNFPRDEFASLLDGEVYGRSALQCCRSDKVRYLVWVTVESWYTDTKSDNGSRFGKFRDRSIYVTIYNEPDQGFQNLLDESNMYTNLSLDSGVIKRGLLNKNDDIISICGMLQEMCVTFEEDVYFNGMKDVVDAASRGASGQFGSVNVMCVKMCGYDRIMIQDSMSNVVFQLRPDTKHLYVLGQQGTLPQIRKLIKTVVRMWNQCPDIRAEFIADDNISAI